MFFKNYKIKYILGVVLFIFVFTVGFVKINIVFSSTGVAGASSVQKIEIHDDYDVDTLSTINDEAFVRIYKEDYGFDIVFNLSGNEKIFSLKLPWKNVKNLN